MVRSLCPTHVGTRGIVIQETERTFRVITQHNRCTPRRPRTAADGALTELHAGWC